MILTVTPNPCVDKTVFVPELKVGTFMRSARCTCIPGGKGTNVSRAVKALGRSTAALVIVGGHPGAHVVDMIGEQDGVRCIPVWVKSQTRTITTVLEQAVHRQTAFFEPGSRVSDDEVAAMRGLFEAAVRDARVVTFSGTVPDPAIRTLYRDLIPIAQAAGAITILDSHGPELALGLEAAPYMVKPNLAEAQELTGVTLDSDAARWEAIAHFHRLGVELVVLSLGKEGALASRAGERIHVVPPVIEEVNPVGSGDALVAGFAIGLEESMPLAAMARLAVAAGAANAMSWDIGYFTPEEVDGLLERVSVRAQGTPTAD